MDYECHGGFRFSGDEHPEEPRCPIEAHVTFIRGDCLHLAENDGSCRPENDGCPVDCQHFQQLAELTSKARVN